MNAWLFSKKIDLVFTATNVVAHGIPYMALLLQAEKRQGRIPSKATSKGILNNCHIGFCRVYTCLLGGIYAGYFTDSGNRHFL